MLDLLLAQSLIAFAGDHETEDDYLNDQTSFMVWSRIHSMNAFLALRPPRQFQGPRVHEPWLTMEHVRFRDSCRWERDDFLTLSSSLRFRVDIHRLDIARGCIISPSGCLATKPLALFIFLCRLSSNGTWYDLEDKLNCTRPWLHAIFLEVLARVMQAYHPLMFRIDAVRMTVGSA